MTTPVINPHARERRVATALPAATPDDRPRPPLTDEQIVALLHCRGGVDVFSHRFAVLLRQVEALAPELLAIGAACGTYNPLQPQPYFGALLTAAGEELLGLPPVATNLRRSTR